MGTRRTTVEPYGSLEKWETQESTKPRTQVELNQISRAERGYSLDNCEEELKLGERGHDMNKQRKEILANGTLKELEELDKLAYLENCGHEQS